MRTTPSVGAYLWRAAAPVLAAVAAVLGFVGFGDYLGTQAGFAHADDLDRAYYTLQLFIISPSPFGGPPYGTALGVARFLAPLSTGVAVLQAVLSTLRTSRDARTLRRAQGHDVVVGRMPEAFVLAGRLAARGVVVLVGSGAADDVARRHGIRVVEGEAVDEKTLRAAGVPGAARVFALDPSGAHNATVALQVRSLHERASTGTALAVHARVDDAELVAALQARPPGAEGGAGCRVEFVNLERVAAVALLDLHEPGPDAVVVGWGGFAEAVRAELQHQRRRAGVSDAVPLVPCGDATHLTPPTGRTYVCTADTDEVLRVGLHLTLTGHPHVVLCLGRRVGLADALEHRLFEGVDRLTVFGMLDAACDPDRLTTNALVDQLARALHARYRREHGGTGDARDVPWAELDERTRDDHRRHAVAVGAALASLPAVVVPAAPGLPAFTLTDDEVERLAATGQDRTSVRGWPALLATEDLAIVRRVD